MRAYFFKTTRLGFLHWGEYDTEQAYSLWGDKNVTKYLTASGEFTREEVNARLKLEIENERLYRIQYWPVFELETEKFIGCCGLRPYDSDKKIYEIGIHLKPEFQGRGYGIEAADNIIKYAFERLGAEKIFAGHNPLNKASAGLLAKLGFKFMKDEYYEPTGLYHPSYIYDRETYTKGEK